MTTQMRAAFTLTLEDKLSAGLKNIQKAFEDLRSKGNELTLGGLQRGGEMLATVTREVRNLTSSLDGVKATADRAWSAIKRVGAAHFGPDSRLGQVGAKVGALGAAAAGVSIYEPIHSYAEFENIARHSAITEGLSGPRAAKEAQRLMAIFRKDALETGQSSESIAQAFQDLLNQGINVRDAEKLLPIHSRAATAYNITTEDLGPAVAALTQNFKLDETNIGGALASMALASKEGTFKVPDFARYLKAIGGDFSSRGMTGRGSADFAFASLETVMKNAGDPNTGAANFRDFIGAIYGPHAARTFALDSRGMPEQTKEMLKQYNITGINLPKVLEGARLSGANPIAAVLDALQSKVKGLPPDVVAQVLGAMLGNQQSRDAAQSLLQHRGEMDDLLKKLHGADDSLLGKDFNTAFAAPLVQLRLATEQLTQLGQRAGEAFVPIMTVVTGGLKMLLGALDALDARFPGLSKGVLGVAGGMLALTAVLGAVGVAAPAVIAGFELIAGVAGLLLSPIGLIAAGIAAVAYAIYDWDEIGPVARRALHAVETFALKAAGWVRDEIVGAWHEMVDAIASNATVQAAIQALSDRWENLKAVGREAAAVIYAAWDLVAAPVTRAFDAVNQFTDGALSKGLAGIRDIVADIAAAWEKITGSRIDPANQAALDQLSKERRSQDGGPNGQTHDGYGPDGQPVADAAAAAAADPSHVHLTVSAAPGTSVQLDRVPPNVTVSTPNPGQVTGRP